MSNNKNTAGRFAGKGYYIALILCAAAIGISGYLYYLNANGNEPNLEQSGGVVDVLNPNHSTGTGQPSSGDGTQSTAPTLPPKPLKTACPIAGKLAVDYAMDCLCYNPTTRDWRVHDGMDYTAQAGTAVKAAADGTVYTVFKDEQMGYTVVLCHADGYVTTYSSLDENIPVAVGDTVTLGQTIGTVGNSAVLETAIGEHVHFSVTCDGESIDPEEFFNLG